MLELKKLLVDTKDAWIDFEGLEGFKVHLVNLSRKELIKMNKLCTTTKFVRGSHQAQEQFDQDRFVSLFTEKAIIGWEGLTLRNLREILLVDTEGENLDEELDYNKEHAEMLVRESTEFDISSCAMMKICLKVSFTSSKRSKIPCFLIKSLLDVASSINNEYSSALVLLSRMLLVKASLSAIKN